MVGWRLLATRLSHQGLGQLLSRVPHICQTPRTRSCSVRPWSGPLVPRGTSVAPPPSPRCPLSPAGALSSVPPRVPPLGTERPPVLVTGAWSHTCEGRGTHPASLTLSRTALRRLCGTHSRGRVSAKWDGRRGAGRAAASDLFLAVGGLSLHRRCLEWTVPSWHPLQELWGRPDPHLGEGWGSGPTPVTKRRRSSGRNRSQVYAPALPRPTSSLWFGHGNGTWTSRSAAGLSFMSTKGWATGAPGPARPLPGGRHRGHRLRSLFTAVGGAEVKGR